MYSKYTATILRKKVCNSVAIAKLVTVQLAEASVMIIGHNRELVRRISKIEHRSVA